ncbi:MAG TPA: trypsin-like peptidase domain-containing protein [Pyrinomonadaceae bacterium]|jgi:V8-like Glu-specific endopeptidase|nr:trypsin-like peptidase domain-containing protein [Pyrinomonadaceae bacterium]
MRRLLFVATGAFFVIATLLPMQRSFIVSAVSDGERLAMYSKPAVVRIVDGAAGQILFSPPGIQPQVYNVQAIGLGSGFFISSNGYIATNAHVVSMTHDGEDKAKQTLFYQLVQQIAQQYNKDPRTINTQFIDQYSQLQSFNIFHHVIIPDGSSYPFEIKQYGAPTGESNDQGKDVAIIKIEVKNAPILKLADSDKVQLQDHVTVIGYPGAADTFNTGTLSAKSAFEATINDGKISAKKQATSGAPILQTSTAATHGNSGGPVINDANEVVGLLTFRGDTVNGQEVSGFSFVVPSNTVMEYVKSAGASNVEGPTDTVYREGLDNYWNQYYSVAIPKFEEVKRLFPQHSEVDRLVQSSQQAKAEGKEKSSFPFWIVAVIIGVLFVLLLLLIIIIVGILIARKRRKGKASGPAVPDSGRAHPKPAPAPAAPAPSPAVNYAKPAPPPPPPAPAPHVMAGDQGMTVDLSRTIAITADGDSFKPNYGSIMFVSGPLSGQQFEIKPDGDFIGRDGGSSQIVIGDPRISKRHVWIGVRNGRVVIEDQNSRNGTFVNDPRSARVTEQSLNAGDVVILGESDVARFEYHH